MESKPANTLAYKVIIGILLAIIAVMAFMLLNQKKEIIIHEKDTAAVTTELKDQLDSLLAEHERVKVAYGELSDSLTDRDSIINARAMEIKQLLGSKAELAVVKQKLAQLQQITQVYKQQIDSLFTVNRALKDENEKIKVDFNLEQQKTTNLSKDKEALNEKITGAAVLKAYKVTAVAFKSKGVDKEKETDKAARTDKIKVCFTVGENKLVSAGYKRFFVRIARPDNVILTRGPAYTFQFLGQTLQFSAMETLNFEGEAADVCTYFERPANGAELVKGKYVVNIFTEDREIGQTSFELK
jgi:regulator of replication initiation timing